MIPFRLPWRRWARPSATLHEIRVRSEELTCVYGKTDRVVCQGGFEACGSDTLVRRRCCFRGSTAAPTFYKVKRGALRRSLYQYFRKSWQKTINVSVLAYDIWV